MAVDPSYLVAITQQITRLKDPKPLDAAEERLLRSYLNSDDQVEIEERYRDIQEVKKLLVLPVGVSNGWDFYSDRRKNTQRMSEALDRARTKTGRARSGIAKATDNLKKMKELGYKNPNLFLSEEADLENWNTVLQGYIEDVRRAWNAMPEEARKRYYFHRGEIEFGNLPVEIPEWEKRWWPDEPSNRRLAQIETLERKVSRLAAELEAP